MKKFLAVILAAALMLTLVACGDSEEGNVNNGGDGAGVNEPANVGNDEAEAEDVKSEGVMTYAEYAAAAVDTQVTVEAAVLVGQ